MFCLDKSQILTYCQILLKEVHRKTIAWLYGTIGQTFLATVIVLIGSEHTNTLAHDPEHSVHPIDSEHPIYTQYPYDSKHTEYS